MDNHTRKLLELTDKHLFFDEEWLIEKEYKGVQAQFIKGRLDDSPSHCEPVSYTHLTLPTTPYV